MMETGDACVLEILQPCGGDLGAGAQRGEQLGFALGGQAGVFARGKAQRGGFDQPQRVIGHQIDALQVTITEAGKRTRRLISEKDTLETRRNLLGDTNVTDEEIAAVRERLEMETARLQEAQGEKARLEQHLSDLEAYWEKLEGDYQEREKALEWMKTLPEGHEGTVAFLNGLTSDYVRAFALDIIVYDPLHYTVHWFDDTKTQVEMYSNVEDFRYTSDYFDGQRMRSKREFRRA